MTDYQYEEPIEEEREQLEEILKEVPYNLSVACIKLCQVNKYMPLPLEKYYEHILPTFHLLRRTDGSRYTTTSIKTVRSAMTSEKIFERNDEGLYVLNIKTAINFLRNLQKKVMLQGGVKMNKNDDYDNIDNNMPKGEKKYKKKKKKDDLDDQGSTGDSFNEMLGQKRRMMQMGMNMNGKKIQKQQVLRKVQKYEKAYELFQNLLRIFSRNNDVVQKLNFDFENMTNEDLDLSDNNPDMNKIIGMLSVFKFFKPFLEKSLDSCKQQERIMEKIGEVNDELNYMNALFRSEE
jgi:hypothetical protein